MKVVDVVVENVVFPEKKVMRELENMTIETKKANEKKFFNSDTISRKDMDRFKAEVQKGKGTAFSKPEVKTQDPKLDLSCLAPSEARPIEPKDDENLPPFKFMDFARLLCNPGQSVLENSLLDPASQEIKDFKMTKSI